MDEMAKYRFDLFIIPSLREILMAIFCVISNSYIHSLLIPEN